MQNITSLPWQCKRENDGSHALRISSDTDGLILADVLFKVMYEHAPLKEYARANAEFICKAVNEHDILVAQRDALLEACKDLICAYVDCRPDDAPDWTEDKMQALQDAKAAIAICEPKEKEQPKYKGKEWVRSDFDPA